MSKLSEPLKQFINAAHARPNTIPAPRNVASVYEKIASEAGKNKVGLPAWLCASVCDEWMRSAVYSKECELTRHQTAATMTMNSPESMLELYRLANSPANKKVENQGVYTAELMREVGLKCIGFNGV